jgi:outer membrane protein assembly factor BamB
MLRALLGLGVVFTVAQAQAREGQTSPRVVWRFVAEGPLSEPSVSQGAVFVVSGSRSDTRARDGRLHALDAATGKLRWQRPVPHGLAARPVLAAGRAIALVSTFDPGGAPALRLLAFGLADGEPVWERTVPGWLEPPARLEAGRLVLRTLADPRQGRPGPGALHAFEATGGQPAPAPAGPQLDPESLFGPARPGGGRTALRAPLEADLFLGLDRREVFVGLDTRQAALVWSFEVPELQRQGQVGGGSAPPAPWFAPPTVAGAQVLVAGSFPAVYALEARTGRVLWRAGLAGSSRHAPVLAAGAVLVGDASGHLRALDGRTGQSLWEFVEERRSAPGPGQGLIGGGVAGVAEDGGRVYMSSANEVLYCLAP